MSKLKDKVAVITGGSSGIGIAVAKIFIENGAKVIITGKSFEKLQQVKLDINSDHVLEISADVSKLSDIDAMYDEIVTKFGSIDIIVANAGVGSTSNVCSVD